MIALITGITGQTGGYLCDQLIDAGWDVHGLVRNADETEPDFRARSPQATLHSGDLSSVSDLETLVSELEPTAIFNLAGLSSVAESWREPELTGLLDGLRVGTLLNAAWTLRNKVGRPVAFVQASSAEIFGAATEVPQTEETPVRPTNPYGAAKAYAHHLVGVYRGLGLEASSCILYNHESPRRPAGFVTRKITMGVARIAAGLDDALVLGNLDASRDWGWAPDYARALALSAGVPGDYVIATGRTHTVREFVACAFETVGVHDWEHFVSQDPAFLRPTDAPMQVGDASRARATLGWEPEVQFPDIVRMMVENDVELLKTRS